MATPPPPLEMWFLGSSGNFKQLLFLEFFFFQNFFFTSKKIFPLSIFYTFLDVLYHPECSKKFSPKIFLGEAKRDTMLPSISSLLLQTENIVWNTFKKSIAPLIKGNEIKSGAKQSKGQFPLWSTAIAFDSRFTWLSLHLRSPAPLQDISGIGWKFFGLHSPKVIITASSNLKGKFRDSQTCYFAKRDDCFCIKMFRSVTHNSNIGRQTL